MEKCIKCEAEFDKDTSNALLDSKFCDNDCEQEWFLDKNNSDVRQKLFGGRYDKAIRAYGEPEEEQDESEEENSESEPRRNKGLRTDAFKSRLFVIAIVFIAGLLYLLDKYF